MLRRIVPSSRISTFFAYAYLLRVQLVIVAVMVLLPISAIGPWSGPRALFENLFVTTPYGFFLSTLAVLLLAWSVLLTSRLVLLNGYDRFGVKQKWTANTLKPRVVFIAASMALPIIGVQWIAWTGLFGWHGLQGIHPASEPVRLRALFEAVSAGSLGAYLVAYAGVLFAVALAPASTQQAAQTFPAWWFLRTWLRKADALGLPDEITRPFKRWVRRWPPDFYAGYIDKRRRFPNRLNPGYQLPWSGHFITLTFAALTFLVYYLIGWYRSTHIPEATAIPALTFLLLLLLIVNWVGSLLTFFFDRFRVPVLLPMLALAFVTSHFSTDHIFSTIAHRSGTDIAPSSVVAVHASLHPGPIIVVATAGGGIQAAAWTARVLTGLQRESLTWQVPMAERIALVSAVSGGAVGSMFFLNEYKGQQASGAFTANTTLKTIVDRAEAPALDDVAWSLVYNDLPRVFTSRGPADPLLDRGRVLERYWQEQGHVMDNLSDWRAGVAEGWRPAVIFNATIAETGEPLLFATSDLTDQDGKNSKGQQVLPVRKSFRHQYPDLDVPVVTAVRLASSFPYVSPASRANGSRRNDHLIDGGYYDNFGVASAVDWIAEAARSYAKGEFPEVLFILIKSFPDDPLPVAESRGWFFQSYAPLNGFFNVRTTTQLVRDRAELLLLRDRLKRDDKKEMPRVRFATFQFPEDGAPLSWKMNGRQIDAIETQWKMELMGLAAGDPVGNDLLQVKCVLLGTVSKACTDIADKAPW